MIDEKKLKEWVDSYIRHVNSMGIDKYAADANEGYKFKAVDIFQNKFDANALDLKSMLDQAIPQNNLCAGAHFFPKGMLLQLSAKYPQEVRNALNFLFDEDTDAMARINDYVKVMNALTIKFDEKKEGIKSFANLRFISLLLAYRFPDKYYHVKPEEYLITVKQ